MLKKERKEDKKKEKGTKKKRENEIRVKNREKKNGRGAI